MNFGSRGRRRDNVELPIIPLIDIVIFLLIFFVITTTFERNSAIVIHLPEASNKKETATKDTIDLTIDATGRFYVNNQLLLNAQLETVERGLTAAQAGRTNRGLMINADGQTPHQAVVTALDAARRVGNFSAVNISTRTPTDNK